MHVLPGNVRWLRRIRVPWAAGSRLSAAPSTVARLWFAQHGRTVWLAFACREHAGDLIAPATGAPTYPDRSQSRGLRLVGDATGTRQDGRGAPRLPAPAASGNP